MANKDKWSLGAAVLASVATILAYFGGKNEASDDGTLTSALNPCNPDTVTHLCTDETSADAKMTYMYQDSVFGTPKSCSDITISSLRQSGTTKYSCTKCPFLPQYENNFITGGVGNLNAFVDIKCWAPDNYNAVANKGLPQIPRLQQDNTVQEGNPCREPDGSALPSLDYKVGQVQPVGVNVDYVRCMRNDDSGKYVWRKFSYSADDGIFDKMVQFSQYCTGLLVPPGAPAFISQMQYFAQGQLTTQEEITNTENVTCQPYHYKTTTQLEQNLYFANVASCYGKDDNGNVAYQCPAGYQIQLSGCTQCPAGTVNGEVNGYGCSECRAGTAANSQQTTCSCKAGLLSNGAGCVCEPFVVELCYDDSTCNCKTHFTGSDLNTLPPTDQSTWIPYPAFPSPGAALPHLKEQNILIQQSECSSRPTKATVVLGAGTMDFWYRYQQLFTDTVCVTTGGNKVSTWYATGSLQRLNSYSEWTENSPCYVQTDAQNNPPCTGLEALGWSAKSTNQTYDLASKWHTCNGIPLSWIRLHNDCVDPPNCNAFSNGPSLLTCAGTATHTCTDTAGVDCSKEDDCLSWCYEKDQTGCCYRTDDGTCEFYENEVPTPGTSSQHHAAACFTGT